MQRVPELQQSTLPPSACLAGFCGDRGEKRGKGERTHSLSCCLGLLPNWRDPLLSGLEPNTVEQRGVQAQGAQTEDKSETAALFGQYSGGAENLCMLGEKNLLRTSSFLLVAVSLNKVSLSNSNLVYSSVQALFQEMGRDCCPYKPFVDEYICLALASLAFLGSIQAKLECEYVQSLCGGEGCLISRALRIWFGR